LSAKAEKVIRIIRTLAAMAAHVSSLHAAAAAVIGETTTIRVGILGAGAAGMSAAAKLRQEHLASPDNTKNLVITLIEARQRIGGRLLTTDLSGTPLCAGVEMRDDESCRVLEFGAQWLHDFSPENFLARTPGLMQASKIELSARPDIWGFDFSESLQISRKNHPDVTNEDIALLDLWLDPAMAATVARHDANAESSDEEEVGKEKADQTSALDLVDKALSERSLRKWWRKSGPKLCGDAPFPSAPARALAREAALNMVANYHGLPAERYYF
jgi:monoamine oxidase